MPLSGNHMEAELFRFYFHTVVKLNNSLFNDFKSHHIKWLRFIYVTSEPEMKFSASVIAFTDIELRS